MRYRWILLGVAVLVLLIQVVLLAQNIPAFKITADSMTLDLSKDPKVLVYQNNVKFTSPLYQTNITCNRLETNSASVKTISTVQASGNVAFTMVVEPADKGKPTYKLTGTSPLMTFTMQEKNHVLRLLKEKDVRPALIMTDVATKEVTDLTGAADVIEYNLDTRQLKLTGNVETESKGGNQ